MMRRPAKKLRRRLRLPRRLKTTPEGKWFLLLTVGVGVAAMNTGNNLLYIVLGMNLSLIVVSGFLSEWCLRKTAVRIGHASEAFAGATSFLSITCRAAGRFPAMSVSVAVHLPGAPGKVPFPDLAPGSEATRIVPYVPAKRGAVFPVRCTISTMFPFAFFEKFADTASPDRLVAYPSPRAGPEPTAPVPSVAAGETGTRPGRRGTAIRGVRDHIPSDPVRDIHWKASARLARWVVKEREEESMPALVIRVPEPDGTPETEREISFACARILACEREGRPYRLYIGEEQVAGFRDTDRRARALTALALLPGPASTERLP